MPGEWGCGRREDLVRVGQDLDDDILPHAVAMEEVLTIRDRLGRNGALVGNEAQKQYERKVGQRNIVLKARQIGVSTWIAGRFFLRTLTHPGTVTVQVA